MSQAKTALTASENGRDIQAALESLLSDHGGNDGSNTAIHHVEL